jgi:hypothetical protein
VSPRSPSMHRNIFASAHPTSSGHSPSSPRSDPSCTSTTSRLPTFVARRHSAPGERPRASKDGRPVPPEGQVSRCSEASSRARCSPTHAGADRPAARRRAQSACSRGLE